MRLFQILDTATRTPLPEYFAHKPEAKKVRQALNAEHNAKLRFIVVPGPDHRRYRVPQK